MRSKQLLPGIFLIAAACVLCSCQKETDTDIPEEPLTPYTLYCPDYFPELDIPADNPLTLEGIALGRSLYYDPILSNNGKSCSSCHKQEFAFTNPAVNSLPHMNLAWNNKFLWNGSKEGTLENVMLFEVETFFNTDLSKLNAHPDYPSRFRKVFKTGVITSKEVAYALAQFIRTQSSTNARFDQYMRYEANLNASEWRGFVIFNTEKGDCFHCHSIGLFLDNSFHNIGLDSDFSGTDLGRFAVTGDPADIGKFKTPSLRNVELTAPYMHDGRMATLEEVVEHYNSRVINTETLDPILTKPNHLYGLQLSEQDKSDLVDFLKALTDTAFLHDPGLSKP